MSETSGYDGASKISQTRPKRIGDKTVLSHTHKQIHRCGNVHGLTNTRPSRNNDNKATRDVLPVWIKISKVLFNLEDARFQKKTRKKAAKLYAIEQKLSAPTRPTRTPRVGPGKDAAEEDHGGGAGGGEEDEGEEGAGDAEEEEGPPAVPVRENPNDRSLHRPRKWRPAVVAVFRE